MRQQRTEGYGRVCLEYFICLNDDGLIEARTVIKKITHRRTLIQLKSSPHSRIE